MNAASLSLDELVAMLKAGNHLREAALAELRRRACKRCVYLASGGTGTLNGRRVYRDDIGAYSSGYICDAETHRPIAPTAYERVVWDAEWIARRDRMRALLDSPWLAR